MDWASAFLRGSCCSENRDKQASWTSHTTGIGGGGQTESSGTLAWAQTALRPPERFTEGSSQRERIPVCQASHAHPGLQEGPEIWGRASLGWVPSQYHPRPHPSLTYIWPGLLE